MEIVRLKVQKDLYDKKTQTVLTAGRKNRFSITIIVVVSVVIALLVASLVLVALGYCLPGRRETKKNDEALQQENGKQQDMRTAESLQFDLGTLETATNKFSEDNKLGEALIIFYLVCEHHLMNIHICLCQ
ncbi:unnamed protein product [Malus baccata var. baccata]